MVTNELKDLMLQAGKDMELSDCEERESYYGGMMDAYYKCIEIIEKHEARKKMLDDLRDREEKKDIPVKMKVGQILSSTRRQVVQKVSGKIVDIPKGNLVIIRSDRHALHIRDNCIQPLGEEVEVVGYDTIGISKYLLGKLSYMIPIEAMCEEFCVDISEISEVLDDGLRDIFVEDYNESEGI